MEEGAAGETYNIGGHNESKNIDTVKAICALLDKRIDKKPDGVDSFESLIEFVEDRPGHDLRYAIDAAKIETELGWKPYETFETGLEKTVDWYLENREWSAHVLDGSYQGERLGLNKATSV